jgi:hypothetical protein
MVPTHSVRKMGVEIVGKWTGQVVSCIFCCHVQSKFSNFFRCDIGPHQCFRQDFPFLCVLTTVKVELPSK